MIPESPSRKLEAFHATFRTGSIPTSSLSWPYALGGAGDRTVIVLGGLGATEVSMFSLALRLAESMQVLCLGIPPGVDRCDACIAGIQNVLDQLGIGRCSLLGHSMGGMVALALALKSPDRIQSLVLSNTAIYQGPRRQLIPLAAGWMAHLSPNAAQRMIGKQMGRLLAGLTDGAFWLRFYRDELEQNKGLGDQARLFKRLAEHIAGAPFQAIRSIPTLVIQAEDDRGFTSAEKCHVATLFDAVTVLNLPPPTGHLSFLTREEEYTSAVISFLTS